METNPDPIPLSETARKGRTYLVCALALVAGLVVSQSIKTFNPEETQFTDILLTLALTVAVAVLAFRGGQVSLRIVRGCMGFITFLAMMMLLMLVSAISLRGFPENVNIAEDGTLLTLLMTFGVGFSTWALFWSKEVKAFVEYQRAKFHRQKMDQIKQSVLNTRR